MAVTGRLRKRKPDPDTMYVAWQSFVVEDDGVEQGEQLPGSHELVQRHFAFFIPADTPRRLWPSIWDDVVAQNEATAAEEEREREAHRAAMARRRVCIRGISEERELFAGEGIYATYHLVDFGDIVEMDDELVAKYPDRFVTIAEFAELRRQQEEAVA
jgi:hypothetical protein